MVFWEAAGKRSLKLAGMSFILLLAITQSSVIGDKAEDKEHVEQCKENLRAIGEAIKAYRADHNGEMPDWLSDLYPDYLSDKGILICPADKSAGVLATHAALKDPKMPCSYILHSAPVSRTSGI